MRIAAHADSHIRLNHSIPRIHDGRLHERPVYVQTCAAVAVDSGQMDVILRELGTSTIFCLLVGPPIITLLMAFCIVSSKPFSSV